MGQQDMAASNAIDPGRWIMLVEDITTGLVDMQATRVLELIGIGRANIARADVFIQLASDTSAHLGYGHYFSLF